MELLSPFIVGALVTGYFLPTLVVRRHARFAANFVVNAARFTLGAHQTEELKVFERGRPHSPTNASLGPAHFFCPHLNDEPPCKLHDERG